jgi:hypothetical protein
MARILLNVVVWLGLIGSVSTVVAWASGRSCYARYFRVDPIREGVVRGRQVALVSRGGALMVSYDDFLRDDVKYLEDTAKTYPAWTVQDWHPADVASGNPTFWNRFGFSAVVQRGTNGVPEMVGVSRWISAPDWFVAVVLASPGGAVLLMNFRRRRLSGRNKCTACGYDLRATPDRCPECGKESAPPEPPGCSEHAAIQCA